MTAATKVSLLFVAAVLPLTLELAAQKSPTCPQVVVPRPERTLTFKCTVEDRRYALTDEKTGPQPPSHQEAPKARLVVCVEVFSQPPAPSGGAPLKELSVTLNLAPDPAGSRDLSVRPSVRGGSAPELLPMPRAQ
jgi:hypothetical protein